MSQFRKKPVVVEAIQWNGTWSEIASWLESLHPDTGMAFQPGETPTITANDDGSLIVSTLEGVMRADAGDWIIQGVAGELYPCKPAIFHETYEAVVE